MKIQRIRTETVDNHKPNLRNRYRVVLEVDVIPQNGKILFGRLCKQGVSRIEVYEDEVDAVLAKVKTKDAKEALALARTICDGYREQWAAETRDRRAAIARLKTEEEREEYIDLHCNMRPEMFISLATGGKMRRVGALESVKVVARDEKTTITVPEFKALDQAERDARWLIDPPPTTQNATEQAGKAQVMILAEVLRELRKQDGGNAPTPKGRGK